MTPKYEELGRKLTIEPTDEKFRRYFLGQLAEEDNDRLEEQIAVETVSFEQARIVESELIDDYHRGDLSASDRDAFHASYLRGKGRRERLAVAAALWRVSNEQPTRVFAVDQQASPPIWRFLRWPAFASFAAVVLLSTLVYIAFRPNSNVEISKIRNPDQPIGIGETGVDQPSNTIEQQPTNPPVANNIDNSNSQGSGNTLKGKPKEPRRVSPVVASFTVLPGALRGAGEQSIKITPTTRSVDLRMGPPTDAPKYRAYAAVMKTADGETVFEARNLRSLRFTLPADKLENRTYIIFLEGRATGNTLEPVAEYTFRVRR